MSNVATASTIATSDPREKRRIEAVSCDVVALSQQAAPAWDRYVRAHTEGTLFHTSAWHDAVCSTFGHTPFYVEAKCGGEVAGVLPMFLVKSHLAGRMLVSVPYGVGGGAIAQDADVSKALIETAKRIVAETGSTLLDLRSARAVASELTNNDRYVTFERALPDREEDVLTWLPRKARAAARNGRDKYRLTVSWDHGNLRRVWRLYTIGMRRLGSLAYPFSFFKQLCGTTGAASWVSLISWRGEPVAGLVTFCHSDRVMPYFFGATERAKQCSAANFAYLTAMERAVAAGYRVFDFGRSRSDNAGSYNFKRFHGFEPKPLGYQRYVPLGGTASNLTPSNPKFRWARCVWPHLPLCLTQMFGARLARHIPG